MFFAPLPATAAGHHRSGRVLGYRQRAKRTSKWTFCPMHKHALKQRRYSAFDRASKSLAYAAGPGAGYGLSLMMRS